MQLSPHAALIEPVGREDHQRPYDGHELEPHANSPSQTAPWHRAPEAGRRFRIGACHAVRCKIKPRGLFPHPAEGGTVPAEEPRMQEAADGGYPFRAGTRYINRVFPAASMIDTSNASLVTRARPKLS